TLLLFFFTTIGLNAKLADVKQGGKSFVILLALTLIYLIIQDVIGMTTAAVLGGHPPSGLLVGSASLMGGHGTVIAWAPIFESHGVKNAMEIGIAAATFGLILASIIGGPLARFLINKNNLQSTLSDSDSLEVGVKTGKKPKTNITYSSFLSAFLTISVCILLGDIVYNIIQEFGITLPKYVCCLLIALILTNTVPYFFRQAHSRFYVFEWPARTPALGLLAELSLGIFLVMSLMSMRIWELVDLAGPMLIILLMQLIFAILYIILIVFRAMGKNYDAAVICGGFGGIALGSTSTAMINMSAVTKRYGASHIAFIILPLVAALFLDIANSIALQVSISLFS
ncbi:sodium/glutamate symporter, partial [Francisellaceae bacterium]|nr:sodium/glutamate symporter [Francisellaceae bacterium]